MFSDEAYAGGDGAAHISANTTPVYLDAPPQLARLKPAFTLAQLLIWMLGLFCSGRGLMTVTF